MKKIKKGVKSSESQPDHFEKTGLDNWNDRLDENLETEHEGNELADEKAKDYSYRNGSGDQSDELAD